MRPIPGICETGAIVGAIAGEVTGAIAIAGAIACADGRAESGCAIVAPWASTRAAPTLDGVRGRDSWPGSVGAIGWMWSPHCWQYAKPTGVEVPHRGHVIVVALGRTGATVGGAGVPNGTAPGMFAGMLGSGVGIGALDATITAGGSASDAPHDRQNFMPGGLSPRQTLQMMGNPPPAAGVCWMAGASALPQFKQNDDPNGLSWPQTRHLIRLLRVWPKRRRTGMAAGGFATPEASC